MLSPLEVIPGQNEPNIAISHAGILYLCVYIRGTVCVVVRESMGGCDVPVHAAGEH